MRMWDNLSGIRCRTMNNYIFLAINILFQKHNEQLHIPEMKKDRKRVRRVSIQSHFEILRDPRISAVIKRYRVEFHRTLFDARTTARNERFYNVHGLCIRLKTKG